MKENYTTAFQVSLNEIRIAEKRKNSLKVMMQIIFIVSFLLLLFLAIAKAQGI